MEIENLDRSDITYFRNETGFTVDINGKRHSGDFIEEGDNNGGLTTTIKWDEPRPTLSEQEDQEIQDMLLNGQ